MPQLMHDGCHKAAFVGSSQPIKAYVRPQIEEFPDDVTEIRLNLCEEAAGSRELGHSDVSEKWLDRSDENSEGSYPLPERMPPPRPSQLPSPEAVVSRYVAPNDASVYNEDRRNYRTVEGRFQGTLDSNEFAANYRQPYTDLPESYEASYAGRNNDIQPEYYSTQEKEGSDFANYGVSDTPHDLYPVQLANTGSRQPQSYPSSFPAVDESPEVSNKLLYSSEGIIDENILQDETPVERFYQSPENAPHHRHRQQYLIHPSGTNGKRSPMEYTSFPVTEQGNPMSKNNQYSSPVEEPSYLENSQMAGYRSGNKSSNGKLFMDLHGPSENGYRGESFHASGPKIGYHRNEPSAVSDETRYRSTDMPEEDTSFATFNTDKKVSVPESQSAGEKRGFWPCPKTKESAYQSSEKANLPPNSAIVAAGHAPLRRDPNDHYREKDYHGQVSEEHQYLSGSRNDLKDVPVPSSRPLPVGDNRPHNEMPSARNLMSKPFRSVDDRMERQSSSTFGPSYDSRPVADHARQEYGNTNHPPSSGPRRNDHAETSVHSRPPHTRNIESLPISRVDKMENFDRSLDSKPIKDERNAKSLAKHHDQEFSSMNAPRVSQIDKNPRPIVMEPEKEKEYVDSRSKNVSTLPYVTKDDGKSSGARQLPTKEADPRGIYVRHSIKSDELGPADDFNANGPLPPHILEEYDPKAVSKLRQTSQVASEKGSKSAQKDKDKRTNRTLQQPAAQIVPGEYSKHPEKVQSQPRETSRIGGDERDNYGPTTREFRGSEPLIVSNLDNDKEDKSRPATRHAAEQPIYTRKAEHRPIQTNERRFVETQPTRGKDEHREFEPSLHTERHPTNSALDRHQKEYDHVTSASYPHERQRELHHSAPRQHQIDDWQSESVPQIRQNDTYQRVPVSKHRQNDVYEAKVVPPSPYDNRKQAPFLDRYQDLESDPIRSRPGSPDRGQVDNRSSKRPAPLEKDASSNYATKIVPIDDMHYNKLTADPQETELPATSRFGFFKKFRSSGKGRSSQHEPAQTGQHYMATNDEFYPQREMAPELGSSAHPWSQDAEQRSYNARPSHTVKDQEGSQARFAAKKFAGPAANHESRKTAREFDAAQGSSEEYNSKKMAQRSSKSEVDRKPSLTEVKQVNYREQSQDFDYYTPEEERPGRVQKEYDPGELYLSPIPSTSPDRIYQSEPDFVVPASEYRLANISLSQVDLEAADSRREKRQATYYGYLQLFLGILIVLIIVAVGLVVFFELPVL